jgi:hypothetical protein
MIRAAAALALATFVCAPTAWADDGSAGSEASQDVAVNVAAAEQPKADSSASAETLVDNAALNRAFANTDEPIIPTVESPVRRERFGVYFGFRALNLKHAGYDPYSESDALATNAIGLSFTPTTSKRFALHFATEWNIGSSQAYARGAEADLTVNRFALGLEGRWMPNSRFYLYARVMPAAMYLFGEIKDWEMGVNLESSSWTFAVDTSAGAALRLGTATSERKRTASFWLMIDWGYSFAGEASMTFRPAEIEDETRTFGDINLPGLRPGGFVTRTSFAVTF